jgi:hypothetical protein
MPQDDNTALLQTRIRREFLLISARYLGLGAKVHAYPLCRRAGAKEIVDPEAGRFSNESELRAVGF